MQDSDLNNLSVSDDIKNKLFDNGYHSIQELAVADLDNKSSFDFLEEEEMELLKKTLDDFFKRKIEL